MQVSEIIEIARRQANAYARAARVLARLKHTLKATGTLVQPRFGSETEIIFNCSTEEAAGQIAAQLPVKLEMRYTGHSSLLTFEAEIGDVFYTFRVPTIRPVSLAACNVVRKRRRNWTNWHDAYLYFNEYELCKISYQTSEHISAKAMKERLWQAVIKAQVENPRLERFRFVL